MKKHWLFTTLLAITLCVVCCALFPMEAKAAQSGVLTYSIEGGQAIITNCDESASGTVTIPSTLGGYPVTTIAGEAFRDCDNITKVVIPDSVKTIEGDEWGDQCGAFSHCDKLQEVVIGNGLKTITCYTFYECPRLKSVTIGNAVETIGEYAFAETKIANLVILNNVKTIEQYAFYKCGTLASVDLGNCVQTIGVGAFQDCDVLTAVEIPDSVTEMAGDEWYEDGAFAYCDRLQEVVIGNGLKTISEYTFYECPRLESVTIGNGVETIGKYAFAKCGMESIVVPDSVQAIGYAAFKNCSKLRTVSFGNAVKTIGQYAFSESGLKTLELPNSVRTIDYAAFYKCAALTTVDLGNGVETIEVSAFQDCDSLLSITIPDSVTAMNGDVWYYEGAFSHCDKLQEVVVGDGLQEISPFVFYSCPSLKTVTIGSAVDTIGEQAFVESAIETLVIPGNVLEIGRAAFYKCTSLTDITIADGVDTIGAEAFLGCGLTSLAIPDSVVYIGESAFSECKQLTSLDLGNGVETIETSAFQDCDSLLSVVIPDSVKMMFSSDDWYECGAFTSCDNLQNVVIGDGLYEISIYTFNDCPNLKTVTIGANIDTIGEGAFKDCDSLNHVFYVGTADDWNEISIDSGNNALLSAVRHNETNGENLTTTQFCDETKYYCGICDGYLRSTPANGKHKYDDACDTTCNNCPATRVITHKYNPATCTEPKTCKTCGATSGKALGHSYKAATCTAPKTCKTCGATSGKALGHSYKAATCTAPKTCKTCGATSGKALGHTYKTTTTKATLSKNGSIVKKCSVCGKVASTTTIRYAKTFSLSATSYVYNGKVKTPTVTVKDSAGKTLKEGTDYTVTYASGRKNAGTYKVTVKMKGNYSGTKTLTFKILPKAAISTQPKTQKVEAGEKIKFTIKATGTGLKYQWQSSSNGKTWKNCSSSSAKKATFTFTGKTSHDGNYYRCKVTDSAGNTVYTSKVRAYVLGIEEQPVKKTVTKGKTAKFSVEATGHSLTYQWQYSTDGGKTWKNCSSSSAKKAIFSFTAKTSHNGYYYRCKITDSAKNVIYTSKVKLTVKK